MRTPRDNDASTTYGLVRVARTFSNVISPPVIFAVLGLALAWKEVDIGMGLLWAAIFGFWISLAPILLIVYLLMTNRISDLHMSNRRERRLPYITGVVTAAITLLLIEIFNGPELLRGLAVFSLLDLILLGVITNFWLISIHAASITAAEVITALVFGPIAGSLLIPLMLIVGLVRLYLRRHTLAQVAAGALLGAAIVAMLSLAGYFA